MERESIGPTSGQGIHPRHFSVVRLMLEGRTNAQIATDLALTHGTVANYVSEILETTGCQNRAEFISRFRWEG